MTSVIPNGCRGSGHLAANYPVSSQDPSVFNNVLFLNDKLEKKPLKACSAQSMPLNKNKN